MPSAYQQWGWPLLHPGIAGWGDIQPLQSESATPEPAPTKPAAKAIEMPAPGFPSEVAIQGEDELPSTERDWRDRPGEIGESYDCDREGAASD